MAQNRMPMSDTMKRNVDAILNKEYSVLGGAFQDSGINITSRPETTILDIECEFHGHNPITGEDFNFVPYQINRIFIEQKFNESFTDIISINLTLTPVQLLNMLDNYRELYCTLRLFPRDSKSSYIDRTTTYLDNDYIAIFKDKDLRKRISKQALIPDTKLKETNEHHEKMFDNIELQLIDKVAYKVRKQKFNFMMRQATMKDVIFYLAKCIGIEKISIVEPDNTTKYNNLIIPPMHTFASCMEFLQRYYGIYNKGLVYYFTNETLYIYPPFECFSNTPEGTHLYYAGEDACAGSDIYHAYSDGNMLHVVITSTPTVRDLMDGGVESIGTAYFFEHADRIIDGASSVGEGQGSAGSKNGMGDLKIEELNTSIFTPKENDYGISPAADTVQFVFDGDNQFYYKSKMYQFMRTILAMRWQNAIPCSMKPGYQIHYHFDGEDITRRPEGEGSDDANISYSDSAEYMTKDGVAEQLIWTIQPVKGGQLGDGRQMYSCIGDIVIGVEYDHASEEPKQKMSTKSIIGDQSAFTGPLRANGVTSNSTTQQIAAISSQVIEAVTGNQIAGQSGIVKFASALTNTVTSPQNIDAFKLNLSSLLGTKVSDVDQLPSSDIGSELSNYLQKKMNKIVPSFFDLS